MHNQSAIIFVNGELCNAQVVRQFALQADKIIAADGGLKHVFALGLTPHLLIGDLDSVSADEVARARELGCEVRQYPVEKDETDLELALLAAVECGCGSIRLAAALGGRLDQTLANIYLLNLPQMDGVDARLDDGKTEVVLIRSRLELEGRAGDTVSLLPLSPLVRGITTTDLKFPLIDESLEFSRSRGISNVMLSSTATIEVTSGALLCVHIRKEDE